MVLLIERLRDLHEQVERIEQAIADRVRILPANIRQKLVLEHECEFLRREHQKALKLIKDIYENQEEELLREDQKMMAGDGFEYFYEILSEIDEHEEKYPNQRVENFEEMYKIGRLQLAGPDGEKMDVDNMFSAEESWGRNFDLHSIFNQYINLPFFKELRKPGYLQFLDALDHFTPPQLPCTKKQKINNDYEKYLTSLDQYLEDFIRKTRPMEDFEKMFGEFEEEFEGVWEKGEAVGWERKPEPEQTEGTWCEACEKLFTNPNVYEAHLGGKKHKKKAAQREAGTSVPRTGPNPKQVAMAKEKRLARLEFRIRKLLEAMHAIRVATRINSERKAGMTNRERQQEMQARLEEEEKMTMPASTDDNDDGEDDDAEEKIYNPLKLPTSWDGKPIPFWLYKLHGLGIEYSCEICGNFVYMGRRAFDKHFSEARHIYGLKCLGITQSGLFREITKIEEAKKLWDSVQRERKAKQALEENVVEMEDSQGTVMPLKVWSDLEKAGLL